MATMPQFLFQGNNVGIAPVDYTLSSSSWTGSNLTLRSRCVDVDVDFIRLQRSKIASGKIITYYFPRIQNLVAPIKTTQISYNFSINVSSLQAIFGITVMTKDATQKAYGDGDYYTTFGSWGFTPNSQKNIRVYRDGEQLSSFALCRDGHTNDTIIPLMEAVKTIFEDGTTKACRLEYQGTKANSNVPSYVDNARFSSNMTQTTRTFPLPRPYIYGLYGGGSTEAPNTWMWGLSGRESQDSLIPNSGTPCSQMQITVDSTASDLGTNYIFYVSTSCVSFDGAGNALVRN